MKIERATTINGRLVHQVFTLGNLIVYSDKNLVEDDYQKVTFYFVYNDKVEVIQEVSAGAHFAAGEREIVISGINFINAAEIDG